MAKRRNLSIEVRASVVTLDNEGYSGREIAKKLRISRRAVQEILKKQRETDCVADRPRTGRPRATNRRQDFLIYRMSLSDRRATSGILKRDLQDATGVDVSRRTVRRRLNAAGLRGCVAAKKPLLSKVHKKKRLEWCMARKDWTHEQWAKVLWSDESIFELVPSRRVWVRRRKGERYHPDCINSTVKFGGAKIQVWGCMASTGVGSLKVVNDRLNSQKYVELISDTLEEDGRRLCGEHYVFQQDGATCHTARATKAWFAEHDIPLMDPWPPQSADLNPIEHVWDVIKRNLEQHPCKNKTELHASIFDTWNNLDRSVTKKLVASMPRRVRAVIAAHGGHTNY